VAVSLGLRVAEGVTVRVPLRVRDAVAVTDGVPERVVLGLAVKLPCAV
jgi:hypothetical protein